MSAKGSELKRVRQSRKANAYNKHYKSQMNTIINKFMSVSKEEAVKLHPEVVKVIDKVSNKGVIHKNKANNKKSKLSSYLNTK